MSDYRVSLVTKFGPGDVIRQPRIPLELQDIACGWQAVEATSFDYYRELPESDGDLELTRSLSTGTGAGRASNIIAQLIRATTSLDSYQFHRNRGG
jgi:hypothetical protein